MFLDYTAFGKTGSSVVQHQFCGNNGHKLSCMNAQPVFQLPHQMGGGFFYFDLYMNEPRDKDGALPYLIPHVVTYNHLMVTQQLEKN